MWYCVCVYNREQLVEVKISPSALRCRNWTQVTSLGNIFLYWTSLLDTSKFNSIKPISHNFLIDILNNRAQIWEKENLVLATVKVFTEI